MRHLLKLQRKITKTTKQSNKNKALQIYFENSEKERLKFPEGTTSL